jgi:hypothetical protein
MIREAARDMSGVYAMQALSTLAHIAEHAKDSPINGDKNAAVNASEKLLRYAGLAEPEEDKGRGTTVQVVQIGQVGTSPAMQLLVGNRPAELIESQHESTPKGANGAAKTNGVPGHEPGKR